MPKTLRNKWNSCLTYDKLMEAHKFINTSYACIEGRGMHQACLDLQNMMKHCKRIMQFVK